MKKSWNFKILLITFDDVLGMVCHIFTTVERNIPTFILTYFVTTILFMNKIDMKLKKKIIIIIIIFIIIIIIISATYHYFFVLLLLLIFGSWISHLNDFN